MRVVCGWKWLKLAKYKYEYEYEYEVVYKAWKIDANTDVLLRNTIPQIVLPLSTS